MVPLEGQAPSLPKDATYKYRARGAILCYSGLSAEQAVVAKGIGALDISAGAIKKAQLDSEAVDVTKMAGRLHPTRTAASLPANPYTGYALGDTIVLATDNKLYRLAPFPPAGTKSSTGRTSPPEL